MHVFKITSVDDIVEDAFRRLMPQLSSECTIPAAADLARMTESAGTVLFAAAEAGRICGLLTLTVYESPSGVKGMIDDVVVDDSRRGCGIGRMLISAALESAAESGARLVSLTSGLHRTAAHGLYLKMGFREPPSKLYRIHTTRNDA